MLKVHADDGKCRTTAHVQLVSYVSDSYPSVLLNQCINLFSTVHHSWSGQTTWVVFINDACSDTVEPSHPLVHLPLNSTVFSALCQQSSVNLRRFCPRTSFTECNSYPTTCL